uniref:helix-turn-helix domain-containing protein n=1 Tax=Phytomonospora endophytica TaxID=714109 RepID=UPI0016178777|nr:helix-turn-helix domain-containing protein [Phytomonospora endophytica]
MALVEGGGRRLVATGRAPLARDLVQRYAQGESVRAFAADTGRSYVFVHRLLVEPGVRLRARGGGRKAET